jgi:uncharacterized protein (TIGR02118 family)
VKTIVLFRRRPDMTRSAFRDYYETTHVPLAIQHVHFSKYVRNHVIAPDDVPFDVMSEFWLANPVAAAALSSTPAGAALSADEARFMMADRFRATAEETLVAGPPRDVDTGNLRKYALMLTLPPGVPGPDFLAFLRNWCRRLFAGNALTRVTIDVVRPFPGGTFPADAIVSLWPNAQFDEAALGAASETIARVGILKLDAEETPPDMLRRV